LAAIVVSIGVGFLGAKVFSSLFSTTDVIDETGVVIDGNFVDNSVNNAVYNPMVARIGDKLYVSLYPGGIYEISESGKRRLIDECAEIAVIDGELYAEFFNGVKKYDPASGKFVSQDEVNSIYSMKSGDVYIDYEIVENDYEFKHIVRFIYKGKTLKTIEADFSLYYYIDGDNIFYTNNDNELRRFDVSDETDWLVYDFGFDSYPESLIIEDGKLVILSNQYDPFVTGVYYLGLDETEIIFKPIEENEEYLAFNVYDGKVYVALTDGKINVFDLATGEKKTLVEKNDIYHVYIVDDKWVYFIDIDAKGNYSLWRVTQDGSIVEKVMN
jgi:hypothetical protein